MSSKQPLRHFDRSEKSRPQGRKYASLDFSATPRNDNKFKQLIKQINNIFIVIILFLFYFVGIGFGALIYFFFKRENKTSTYWQEVKNEKIDLSSPY